MFSPWKTKDPPDSDLNQDFSEEDTESEGLETLQRKLAVAELEDQSDLPSLTDVLEDDGQPDPLQDEVTPPNPNVTTRNLNPLPGPVRATHFRLTEPQTRTQNAFIRAGLRQSVGSVQPKEKLFEDTPDDKKKDEDLKRQQLKVTSLGPIIDGRTLSIRTVARQIDTFVPARQWNKVERMNLDEDVRQVFTKGATGYVLGKSNKLNAPKVSASSEDQLVTVQNLQSQLKQLKAHMISYDIVDVMTIVIPVDVRNEATLEKTSYDVFEDFSKLHAVHVANSNVWYNTWVSDSYVHDNMVLTLLFLQHNTDEGLWSRCWERYEEYSPVEQGGPLMAYLLLQSIQDSSDQALEHLTTQLKKLNVSKLPGEDIEQAVLLIKSTYRVLRSSSTGSRTYVPGEFIQMVYTILFTCTVKDFTEPLHQHMTSVQLAADLTGSRPAYPSVSSLLNMALNSYKRLKSSGVWDSQTGRKPRASIAAPPTPVAAQASQQLQCQPVSSNSSPPKKICWNCGENHVVLECPYPRNEEKIAKGREKWKAAKRSQGKPKRRTGPDGRPQVLNKRGYYVLDQKAWKAAQLATQGVAAGAGSGSCSTTPRAETSASNVAERATAIKSALKRTVTFSA